MAFAASKVNFLKRIIICAIFITGGIVIQAGASECRVDAGDVIYPYPQVACLTGEITLPREMGVYLSSPKTDGIASGFIDELLKNNGVERSPADRDSSPGGTIGLLVLEPGGPSHESFFRQEGYSIRISGAPLEIRIGAQSPAGFYYALLTLEQLIHPGSKGPAVYKGEVSDFPRFVFRGVLEGGYSVWTHKERVANLAWMGSLKMNSFIYAPKEGEYFRRRWRALYPKERLDEFKEYIDICNRQHVEFSYSISPALSMEYSDPEEMVRLVAKFRQIQELGVRKFGIFFDDVLPYLSTPADRKKYSHIAEAEADVTNRLLKALRERDPKATLFFVPNQYWGWTDTRYYKIIREKLEPEIEIGWTGKDIVSATIPSEDAMNFFKVVGRKPALGDNWSPFGPVTGRAPDLYKYTNTYLNNPYAFAEPGEEERSKFVDSTVADYSWNPQQYDPQRSFLMATRILAGGKTEGDLLLLVLRLIRERSASVYFDHISDMIQQAQAAQNDPSNTILTRLKLDLAGYIDGIEKFEKEPFNAALKGELKPNFESASKKLSSAVSAIDEMLFGKTEKQPTLERLKEIFGLKK
ncbi:MAG: beta-N-acetylglucosaminidase domain-containing protein [bacterium]